MADRTNPLSTEPLADVMQRHQQLMAAFLEQQKQIMLMYLGGRQAPEGVRPSSGFEDARLQPGAVEVSAPAAATRAVTSPPPPLSAPPATASALPPPEAATPASAPSPAASSEDLMQQFVALVAERTGYPPEALAPRQDLEADLGIDSIKRVEILTSFARRFPDLGPEAAQQLRAARRLQDVVQVIRENRDRKSVV